MADLTCEIEYNGSGCKKIEIADLRDTVREIIEKAKEDGIQIDFFREIVQRMPSLGKLALDQVHQKYGHYFEELNHDGARLLTMYMKEIASMDPDLSRRIVRRMDDMFSTFGPLVKAEKVAVGKNLDGKYVVKVVYLTERAPDAGDPNNTYDEEEAIRSTFSDPLPGKEQALFYSMWLSGVMNIRHVDEDDEL